VKIKLLLTALTIVLTTGATAQPNPYAACIAEAAPIYGSVLTIEQLRQYMAEHPSCADGTTPATALPYAPRPAQQRISPTSRRPISKTNPGLSESMSGGSSRAKCC